MPARIFSRVSFEPGTTCPEKSRTVPSRMAVAGTWPNADSARTVLAASRKQRQAVVWNLRPRVVGAAPVPVHIIASLLALLGDYMSASRSKRAAHLRETRVSRPQDVSAR